MTFKEKIITYLNFKNISQSQFTRECNLSNAFLRSGSSFNAELLKTFRYNYPDLNLDWLLYDEGEMIIEPKGNAVKPAELYTKQELYSIAELQQKLIYTQEELLKSKETNH